MEARRKSKEEEAKKRRLEKDLAKAEASIEELEKKIRMLESKMCLPEVFSDHQLSASCSLELSQSKQALDEAYEHWSNLHERFEK